MTQRRRRSLLKPRPVRNDQSKLRSLPTPPKPQAHRFLTRERAADGHEDVTFHLNSETVLLVVFWGSVVAGTGAALGWSIGLACRDIAHAVSRAIVK